MVRFGREIINIEEEKKKKKKTWKTHKKTNVIVSWACHYPKWSEKVQTTKIYSG